jgi:hypothetical protein
MLGTHYPQKSVKKARQVGKMLFAVKTLERARWRSKSHETGGRVEK